MSGHSHHPEPPPLDLSKWRPVLLILVALGGLGALIGALVPSLREQFAYSWLTAFIFYLSLVLGSLFLVMVHHLFDASWSVGLRRFLEQLACCAPLMAVLFIPIAIFAPSRIYPWMQLSLRGEPDHALAAKGALLNVPAFYVISVIALALWWFLASRLRFWSLQQDTTGAAHCTYRMRFYSYWGIFAFAVSVTMALFMWVKSLHHQWFSTMYGVYYFAGSVWTTLATAYLIMVLLKRQGPLRHVIHSNQYYFLGSLLFAFTVFYAYIHFAQYFIIWNANMPEETFWYTLREQGTWWEIGLLLIFGHFFAPFLALIRIDAKHKHWLISILAVWAWCMHYCDMQFNVMPRLHPGGFSPHWLDVASLACMGGLLVWRFSKNFYAHPPYPQKDPRFHETMGVFLPPALAPDEPDEEPEAAGDRA